MEVFDQAWLSVCVCVRARLCGVWQRVANPSPESTPVRPSSSSPINVSPQDGFTGGRAMAPQQVWSKKEQNAQMKNSG